MRNANEPISLLSGLSSGCIPMHRGGEGARDSLFGSVKPNPKWGASTSEEGEGTHATVPPSPTPKSTPKNFCKKFRSPTRYNPGMARTTIQQRRKDNTKSADIVSARNAVNTSTMGAAALVPADKPLTDRQRQFVKFWAEGDTIPNAMQRAGYNEQPSYGYRMAKMPNILVEFDRIKAKWEEAAQTSRQQVMEMHKEAFEMAKMMAEPATMVSAAREIGRMCGYYEPVKQRIEFTVNGQIAVKRIESMSDDDLIRMVTEGMAALQHAALDHSGSTNPDDPDSLGEDQDDHSS